MRFWLVRLNVGMRRFERIEFLEMRVDALNGRELGHVNTETNGIEHLFDERCVERWKYRQ